jgi:hypothetical protein
MEEFCQSLYCLESYFKDWPDDDAAANASDDFHFDPN